MTQRNPAFSYTVVSHVTSQVEVSGRGRLRHLVYAPLLQKGDAPQTIACLRAATGQEVKLELHVSPDNGLHLLLLTIEGQTIGQFKEPPPYRGVYLAGWFRRGIRLAHLVANNPSEETVTTIRMCFGERGILHIT